MKRLTKRVFLAGAVALLFGAGCKEQDLQREVDNQQEIIRSLQNENVRLKQQASDLESKAEAARSQTHDIEADRAKLEEELKGSGVSVGVREGRLAVILPAKVFFAPGKAELSRQGAEALKSVAGILKGEFADKVIRVEGHTDDTPIKKSGYKSNLELSNFRAETVWHYLTEKCGIDARKIYTAGFGQYRPIASNSTPSGMQQNRRVELIVIQE